MPYYCSVAKCNKKSGGKFRFPDRPFLKVYQFPTSENQPALRKRWIERSGREPTKFNPSNAARVCSDHFFDEDFNEEQLSSALRRHDIGLHISRDKIELKPDSIPNTDRRTGERVGHLERGSAKLGPLLSGLGSSKRRRIGVTGELTQHSAPENSALKSVEYYTQLLLQNEQLLQKSELPQPDSTEDIDGENQYRQYWIEATEVDVRPQTRPKTCVFRLRGPLEPADATGVCSCSALRFQEFDTFL